MGIGVLFYNLYYCYDFIEDASYMAMCVRDYRNSPLALLIFYVGHLWCDIFGFSLLSLRILAKLGYLFAISIGSIYLYKRTRDYFWTSCCFLLSCLLANVNIVGFYNWDSGAFPLETLTVASYFFYIAKPSIKRILLAGIITGLLISARIPMVMMTVLACIMIILVNINVENAIKRILTEGLAGILSCLGTILIVWLMILGSVHGIQNAFSPDNIISNHGVNALDIYKWRFLGSFPYVCVAWLGGVTCYALSCQEKLTLPWKGLYCLIGVLIGWSIAFVKMTACNGDDNPTFGLSFPYAIIPGLIIPFAVLKIKATSKAGVNAIVIIATLFIMGIGSDMSFQRWDATFLFLFAVANIWTFLRLYQRRVFKRWILLSLIMLGTVFAYRNAGIKYHYAWPTEKIENRGDVPVYKSMEDDVNAISKEVKRLNAQNKKFTFWGSGHCFYSFAYEERPAYSIHLMHIYNQNIWDHRRDPEMIDGVFFLTRNGISQFEESMESLKSHGFKETKVEQSFILYEK